jgi:hypothetical protein
LSSPRGGHTGCSSWDSQERVYYEESSSEPSFDFDAGFGEFDVDFDYDFGN